MPSKPLRPCSVPGCPNQATHGGKCAAHYAARQREIDQDRPTAAARGYDADWQKIRRAFLKRHSWCARCGKRATVVHHIRRIREGGTSVWSNLEALCKACHDAETMRHDVAK